MNQGFGCMGFSAFYTSAKSTDESKAINVIHKAYENGVTLFNSATFYGQLNVHGYGHNLRLLNKCIRDLDRSKIQIMVKIGMDTKAEIEKSGTRWIMSGAEEALRKDVDFALEQLETDYIDIIVLCRVPTDVTIEEAVLNMKKLVDEGKAKYIGLSEASAATIRKAAAVAPIYCIEQEWSLWSRDIEEEIVPTCRELGIKIVAYSPLGRGFLTGTIRSRDDPNLDKSDYRLNGNPRFAEGNIEKNLTLLEQLESIAAKKGCTVGQLSLAWLHAQGPDVIPIPGTSSINHLEENLAARNISITSEDIDEINKIFQPEKVAGNRYPHMTMTFHGNK
jgi:aryl-alcohol dehydrogenase-like predicted oxidoreductase